jgi:hypothetical protein
VDADCASCPEQWHPYVSTSGPKAFLKCIRYFDNPVNFSEAQYVCNEIYDGDLLSVNSLLEQKLLVQYLHGLLGFKRQPVCWLGGTFNQGTRATSNNAHVTLSNQLKWLDGTQSEYHNFAFDPAVSGQSPSGTFDLLARFPNVFQRNVSRTFFFCFETERKCIKILSLIAKGEQGAPGMWSSEDCKLRDAGFVCQKRIPIKGINSIMDSDMDRARNSHGTFAAVSQSAVSEHATMFLDVVSEQMNAIKELFEVQKKLVVSMVEKFSKSLTFEQNSQAKVEL